MKRRCNSPKRKEYKYYGARGISYDPKWETFAGFWEDMQNGYSDVMTIDRIDNDGNYTKSNCRWILLKDNAAIKRTNVWYQGEFARQASRRLGGNPNLIMRRLKMGWSIERAFSELVHKKFRHQSL